MLLDADGFVLDMLVMDDLSRSMLNISLSSLGSGTELFSNGFLFINFLLHFFVLLIGILLEYSNFLVDLFHNGISNLLVVRASDVKSIMKVNQLVVYYTERSLLDIGINLGSSSHGPGLISHSPGLLSLNLDTELFSLLKIFDYFFLPLGAH